MTKTIIQPSSLRLSAELCCWPENARPDIPETLTLELTADEVAAVHEARALLNRNPHVRSINVRCTPPDIEFWRYDVSYVIVCRDVGSYLYLQGKYDCSEQVEYSVEI